MIFFKENNLKGENSDQWSLLMQWIKCLFPRLFISSVAFSRQTNAALFSTEISNVSYIFWDWSLIQVTACLTDSLF